MTPTTPPPNLTPEEQRHWQAIWEDWYASRQPEPMPVDELPALLRDVAEGRLGVEVTRAMSDIRAGQNKYCSKKCAARNRERKSGKFN